MIECICECEEQYTTGKWRFFFLSAAACSFHGAVRSAERLALWRLHILYIYYMHIGHWRTGRLTQAFHAQEITTVMVMYHEYVSYQKKKELKKKKYGIVPVMVSYIMYMVNQDRLTLTKYGHIVMDNNLTFLCYINRFHVTVNAAIP